MQALSMGLFLLSYLLIEENFHFFYSNFNVNK
jgi:hypothetical protein